MRDENIQNVLISYLSIQIFLGLKTSVIKIDNKNKLKRKKKNRFYFPWSILQRTLLRCNTLNSKISNKDIYNWISIAGLFSCGYKSAIQKTRVCVAEKIVNIVNFCLRNMQ